MKNLVICILSFLLFSCKTYKEDEHCILIKNNWEIEGLIFHKSTIGDIENFFKDKKISFKKDSINNVYQQNDTIEYCGNDYQLNEITYTYSNDSLGLYLHLKQIDPLDSVRLTNYEISKFEYVKFEQGFNNLITKEKLDKYFVKDKNPNLYEAKVYKSTVLIGVLQQSELVYEIKALNVYKDL